MYVSHGTQRYVRWRRSRVRKFRLLNFISALIIFGGVGILLSQIPHHRQLLPKAHADAAVVQVSRRTPATQLAQSPRSLIIPRIQLKVPVELVGLTKAGAMAVPTRDADVGWYKSGPVPGEPGSAVIDGHNKLASSDLGVFGRLKDLRPGDSIIYQDKTHEVHFIVLRSQQYPIDQLPLQDIFKASNDAHLNLITCAGKWNKISKAYSDRLVVYATKS